MKQIFYFLAFAAIGFCISQSASAQYDKHYDSYPRHNNEYHNDRQQSFYFYPQSNVYYSFATGQYIYPYRGSWVVSDRVPRHWHLRNKPRFVVMHYGFDVWNENRFHLARFRTQQYGEPEIVYAPPRGRYDDRGNNSHWYNEDNRGSDWRK